MNEVKAESPSTWYSKHMPIISKLYPYSLQNCWTSKFGKIIPYMIFAQKRALPCVTKIILTEKLFWVGSSNFGFVHLDNWATHEQDPRTKCMGHDLIWLGMTHMLISKELKRASGKRVDLTWNEPIVLEDPPWKRWPTEGWLSLLSWPSVDQGPTMKETTNWGMAVTAVMAFSWSRTYCERDDQLRDGWHCCHGLQLIKDLPWKRRPTEGWLSLLSWPSVDQGPTMKETTNWGMAVTAVMAFSWSRTYCERDDQLRDGCHCCHGLQLIKDLLWKRWPTEGWLSLLSWPSVDGGPTMKETTNWGMAVTAVMAFSWSRTYHERDDQLRDGCHCCHGLQLMEDPQWKRRPTEGWLSLLSWPSVDQGPTMKETTNWGMAVTAVMAFSWSRTSLAEVTIFLIWMPSDTSNTWRRGQKYEQMKQLLRLKLTFRKYPAIHTNYIISHYTTLQYIHNIWHDT